MRTTEILLELSIVVVNKQYFHMKIKKISAFSDKVEIHLNMSNRIMLRSKRTFQDVFTDFK